MANQSHGWQVRAPRIFFNLPRHPVHAEKMNMMPRISTHIVTEPKEATKVKKVTILRREKTTPQKDTSSSYTRVVQPLSMPLLPPRTSSLLGQGSPLTIHDSSCETAGAASSNQKVVTDSTLPQMEAAVRLIGNNLKFTDFVKDYLSDSNTNFTVIGAIGPQGTGKSTLLSMLAGNDHQDMYRYYAFRPASLEAVELCRYQSSKISIYISKSRLILLDCQASFSTSVLDEMIRDELRGIPARVPESFENRMENFIEVESLQLIAFMMQVCHTLLLCVDWFIDLDLIRLLRTSEMLRFVPVCTYESFKFNPHRIVNLVLVHQRAKWEDFEPVTLLYRCKLLKEMFAKSRLNVEGRLNLGSVGRDVYKGIKTDVNYVLLADIKPRSRKVIPSIQSTDDPHSLSLVIDYELVLRTLRTSLQGLPRNSFALDGGNLTEKRWYNLASELWRDTVTSHEIMKFSSILSSMD
uniref:Protein SMG9 n=1 Tax=Ascaris lumbricoides TaxID=6252 RepID=A0A9J2P5S0_ASCLU